MLLLILIWPHEAHRVLQVGLTQDQPLYSTGDGCIAWVTNPRVAGRAQVPAVRGDAAAPQSRRQPPLRTV